MNGVIRILMNPSVLIQNLARMERAGMGEHHLHDHEHYFFSSVLSNL